MSDWVRTWSAAPQAPGAAVAAVEPFANAALRQQVRVSGGGHRPRVRFTNEYGTAPLSNGAATTRSPASWRCSRAGR
jgi:hypothetical protein